MTSKRKEENSRVTDMLQTLLIILLAIVLRDTYTGKLESHWFVMLATIVVGWVYILRYLFRKKGASEVEDSNKIEFENEERRK
jgi:hypothetical protein